MRLLEAFHIRSLQRILRITWKDRVPHNDIMRRANCESAEAMLTRRTLRWVGHMIRMPDERLPKRVLFSELKEGTRRPGGQKKRYKDHIKTTLKACDIEPNHLENLAAERSQWRNSVKQGIQHLETERRNKRDRNRAARHLRQQQPQPQDAQHLCNTCGMACRSRAGLINHTRARHERR